MVVYIAWLVSLLYTGYIVTILINWMRIKEYEKSYNEVEFKYSIIIPIRNEERNIYTLLGDIANQSYNRKNFEVIVVDDYSEDGTNSKVAQAIADFDIDIRLVDQSKLDGKAGKKHAITKGVEYAKYERIICTDGDCRVGENWICQYNLAYQNPIAKMVLASVIFADSNQLFQQIQKIEFLALIGIGAGSLKMGMPTFCNGANLSYLKSVFLEVKGYKGNEEIPSGDDEFLLQKIYDHYPSGVLFNKSFDATSKTNAKEGVREFLNQRIRWSAKWKYHKNLRMKSWGFLMFLFQMSLIIFLCAMFLNGINELFVATLVLRLLVEYVFIYQINSDLTTGRIDVLKTIILQLFYPFYVILLMISSFLGRYSWKGRLYL